MNDDIPVGFFPVVRGGAFFRALGPVYRRTEQDALVLALRVAPQHVNDHGNAHGGMLLTLADGALYDNLLMGRSPGSRIFTVSLSADFLSPARVGDWLEAHVIVQRQGRRVGVADCLLRVGDRRVLRTTATFMEAADDGRAPV